MAKTNISNTLRKENVDLRGQNARSGFDDFGRRANTRQGQSFANSIGAPLTAGYFGNGRPDRDINTGGVVNTPGETQPYPGNTFTDEAYQPPEYNPCPEGFMQNPGATGDYGDPVCIPSTNIPGGEVGDSLSGEWGQPIMDTGGFNAGSVEFPVAPQTPLAEGFGEGGFNFDFGAQGFDQMNQGAQGFDQFGQPVMDTGGFDFGIDIWGDYMATLDEQYAAVNDPMFPWDPDGPAGFEGYGGSSEYSFGLDTSGFDSGVDPWGDYVAGQEAAAQAEAEATAAAEAAAAAQAAEQAEAAAAAEAAVAAQEAAAAQAQAEADQAAEAAAAAAAQAAQEQADAAAQAAADEAAAQAQADADAAAAAAEAAAEEAAQAAQEQAEAAEAAAEEAQAAADCESQGYPHQMDTYNYQTGTCNDFSSTAQFYDQWDDTGASGACADMGPGYVFTEDGDCVPVLVDQTMPPVGGGFTGGFGGGSGAGQEQAEGEGFDITCPPGYYIDNNSDCVTTEDW